MDHVEEIDCYLLVTIVAWLAVRTEAKYFSGTRAFHGNGLINLKVKFIKDKKESNECPNNSIAAITLNGVATKSHIKVE